MREGFFCALVSQRLKNKSVKESNKAVSSESLQATILIIGIAPTLALIGFGAAIRSEQEGGFKKNRTEIMELQIGYSLIDDPEFKNALKEAKERVPDPSGITLIPDPEANEKDH